MSIGYKAEATSANLNAAFISKTVADTAAAEIDFQGNIKTDVIAESTAAAGVTVDGVLIKDNLVDGRDVSVDGTVQDNHIADTSIHFTEASINHTDIQNIGTNTHAQIDTHIADTDLHLTIAAQIFTGKKTFYNGAYIQSLLQLEATQDSSTTGADAVLPSVSPYVAVTNASLTSIGTISGENSGEVFILVNRTGAAITIKNDATGTASQRILTGTAADLELADNASLWFAYDSTESRWYVVGGSGAGGGGFDETSQQALTTSGNITLSTKQLQSIVVAGSSGEAVLSSTPFGTSPPTKPTVIKLIGNSDANPVTINANDAANGCVGNFSTLTLYKYQTAEFTYSTTLSRYVLC